MLETITPPAPDLVTMLTALEYLSIPVADQDPALAGSISRASASIVSHLGYNPNIGTYRETLETAHGLAALPLARLPVTSITNVTLNGEPLDPTLYNIESHAGLLIRVTDGLSRRWEARSVVTVQYQAGFDPLPADLQQAALTLIGAEWAARGRDPGLKSIGIGSINLAYFTPDAAPSVTSVAHLLDPYRSIRVG